MKGLKRYETEKREDITDADGEVEWIILASRDHRPQKASGHLPNTHTDTAVWWRRGIFFSRCVHMSVSVH